MIKHLLLLVVCASLVACAAKYDRLRNYVGKDSGHLVVTVGKTVDNPMNYTHLYFRLKGSEDMGYFEYSPKSLLGGTPKSFETPEGESTLVVRTLPPGEYEIYDYAAGSDYGTSMVWLRKPAAMSIPFTVRSGEVTYLGQFLVGVEFAIVNAGKRPQSARLEISDFRHRDLAQASTASLSGKVNTAVPSTSTLLPVGVKLVQ